MAGTTIRNLDDDVRTQLRIRVSANGRSSELRFGFAIMSVGRRRDALAGEIEAMLRDDFVGRILPFDSDTARAYATIATSRRGRLSDCSDHPLPRHGACSPERPGFPGHGYRHY